MGMRCYQILGGHHGSRTTQIPLPGEALIPQLPWILAAERSQLSPLQEQLSVGGSCLAQGHGLPGAGQPASDDWLLWRYRSFASTGTILRIPPSSRAFCGISWGLCCNCISSSAAPTFQCCLLHPHPSQILVPNALSPSLRVSEGESGIWILFQVELSNRYLVCNSGAQGRSGAEDINLEVVSGSESHRTRQKSPRE